MQTHNLQFPICAHDRRVRDWDCSRMNQVEIGPISIFNFLTIINGLSILGLG